MIILFYSPFRITVITDSGNFQTEVVYRIRVGNACTYSVCKMRKSSQFYLHSKFYDKFWLNKNCRKNPSDPDSEGNRMNKTTVSFNVSEYAREKTIKPNLRRRTREE